MLSFSKGRYRGSFEFHNKLIETNFRLLLRAGDSYLGGGGKGCFWWLMELMAPVTTFLLGKKLQPAGAGSGGGDGGEK